KNSYLMKVEIINLLQHLPELKQMEVDIDTTLSMKPFVRFLKKEFDRKDNVQAPFYKYALHQIHKIPGWDKDISERELKNCSKFFELVYYTFSTPIDEETNNIWALASPLSPIVFYGTSAFYDLWNKKLASPHNEEEWTSGKNFKMLTTIYSFLLDRFYGFSVNLKGEVVQSYHDEITGKTKYYKVSINTQFIDVQVKGELPKLDFSY